MRNKVIAFTLGITTSLLVILPFLNLVFIEMEKAQPIVYIIIIYFCIFLITIFSSIYYTIVELIQRNKNDTLIFESFESYFRNGPKIIEYIVEDEDQDKNFKIISKLLEKTNCYLEANLPEDGTKAVQVVIVLLNQEGQIEEKIKIDQFFPSDFVEQFAFIEFNEV